MGTAYLCRVQLLDGRAASRQREIPACGRQALLRCAPVAESLRAGRMTDDTLCREAQLPPDSGLTIGARRGGVDARPYRKFSAARKRGGAGCGGRRVMYGSATCG